MMETDGTIEANVFKDTKKDKINKESFFNLSRGILLFKNILDSFKSKPIEDEITKKVTDLINKDLFLFAQNIVNEGYKLNDNQVMILNNKIKDRISREGFGAIYELEKKISIPNQILSELLIEKFSSAYNVYYTSLHTSYDLKEKQNAQGFQDLFVSNKFIDSDFSKTLFNELNRYLSEFNEKTKKPNYFKYGKTAECLPGGMTNAKTHVEIRGKDPKEIDKLINILRAIDEVYFKETRNDENLKSYMDFISHLREINQNINKHLHMWSSKIYRTNFEKEKERFSLATLGNFINSLEKKVQNTYTLKSNKPIKSRIERDLNNIYKDGLSIDAINMIGQIESSFKYCSINKEKIELETWLKIEKSYMEELPKGINKFLAVHKDFRESALSSQNKTPNQLFMELLESIKDIISLGVIKINEENITELSVTHRHVQNIKTSF